MTSASQTNCFSCSAQPRVARSAIMRGIQIKAPSSQLYRLYMAQPEQSLYSFQNWNFSFFVLVKWSFLRPDDAPIFSSTNPPFVALLMTHPSGFASDWVVIFIWVYRSWNTVKQNVITWLFFRYIHNWKHYTKSIFYLLPHQPHVFW